MCASPVLKPAESASAAIGALAADAHNRSRSKTAPTGPRTAFFPMLKTFIVEDSPVILENLVATLQELGHVEVVGSVADEAAAVRALEGDEVDLFIVDIFLKSGTGLGFLQRARERPSPPRCVVLTNYANPEVRRRCEMLGAERVFDKSCELEDLIAYCVELSTGMPDAALPQGAG